MISVDYVHFGYFHKVAWFYGFSVVSSLQGKYGSEKVLRIVLFVWFVKPNNGFTNMPVLAPKLSMSFIFCGETASASFITEGELSS